MYASHQPNPLSVLVVDDYPDTTDSLALLLRAEGHDIRAAYSGPTALGLLGDWQPDIALLDLIMPGMGGLQVAERLCDCRPRPVLVAVTGSSRGDHVERARALGFDHYLLKPVDPAAVTALVRARAALRTAAAVGAESASLRAVSHDLIARVKRLLAGRDRLSAAVDPTRPRRPGH
jgi:CheY-like chemotaxis protein